MKVLFKNNKALHISGNILMPLKKIDPYNPADLPPYTIRIKLVEGAEPLQRYRLKPDWTTEPDPNWVQTCIDVENNIWDVTYTSSDWSNTFTCTTQGQGRSEYGGVLNNTDLLEIQSANLAGVTNLDNTFTDNKAMTKAIISMPDAICRLYYTYCFQRDISLKELRLDVSSWTVCPAEWGHNITDQSSEGDYIDVIDMNVSSLIDGQNMFRQIKAKSITLHNCQNLRNCRSMFMGINELETVVLENTRVLDRTSEMFYLCPSLHYMPDIDYSTITRADDMFYGSYWDHEGEGLCEITPVAMPNVVNVSEMFYQQANVSGGALGMYEILADTPSVTAHDNTFGNTGGQTPTGIAELVQIPSSWGGWQ